MNHHTMTHHNDTVPGSHSVSLAGHVLRLSRPGSRRLSAALGLCAVVLLLSGCARLTVELRERPYQGFRYGQPRDASGALMVSDPIDRPRQAVKEARYFWGWIKQTLTPPVEYDYYERALFWPRNKERGNRLASAIRYMFTTEMAKNQFYRVQPFTALGEERNDAFKRSMDGRTRYIDDDGSVYYEDDTAYVDYGRLQPLESSFSPITVMLGRVLTLGMFWDIGYTTDDERWGLRNSARAWSWLGASDVLITMDAQGNFYVRHFEFRPQETIRRVAELALNIGMLAMELQLAAGLTPGTAQSFVDSSDEANKFMQTVADDMTFQNSRVESLQSSIAGLSSTASMTEEEVAAKQAEFTARNKKLLRLLLDSKTAVFAVADPSPVMTTAQIALKAGMDAAKDFSVISLSPAPAAE